MFPTSAPTTLLGPVGVSTNATNINAAATWKAQSFIAKSTNLDSVWVLLNPTGTASNINIQFELQADSAVGMPTNTALATATLSGGWTANIYRNVVFNYTSLVLGQRYWIVFKNTSAAPTVDYPTMIYNNAPVGGLLGGNAAYGYTIATSTDSGGSWTASSNGYTGLLPVFDGQIDPLGWPRDGSTIADVASGSKIYTGQSTGSDFITPNRAIQVVGFITNIRKTGSPTGTIAVAIYVNRSKIATSYAVPVASISTSGGNCPFYFSNIVNIPAKTPVQIVVVMSDGDSTTNYCYLNTLATINTSNSDFYPFKPFNGTLRRAVITGSTWSMTDNVYHSVACMMVLDDPQYSLNRRKYNHQR